MKRLVAIILVGCMTLAMVACGASEKAPVESSVVAMEAETKGEEHVEETAAQTESQLSEEDQIEDDGWDALAALGDVKTENGILTVTITIPADMAENTTQEELDEKAGDAYISAKLNEDGSVTYKMTKKQHKAMLDILAEGFDEMAEELATSDDYTITEVKHNADFDTFDVYLSGSEMGFGDAFAVYTFFIYGAMYGIYSGKTAEKYIANYYDGEDNLIMTFDSSEMEDEWGDEPDGQDASEDSCKAGENESSASTDSKSSEALKIGETWTVDGQWELTITGVSETDDRNQFEEREPEAVYIVDYEYTNLGYEDNSGLWDGLYMGIDEEIVDASGMMGYSYPGDISYYAQETPVGATCKAQACIGVDTAGSFTICVRKYDGNEEKQEQRFLVECE